MTTNTLTVTQNDLNKSFPLRGDMGVALDFVPTSDFSVTFVTYTEETFTFTSAESLFRQLDGTVGASLTIGGDISLFLTLMYNSKFDTWDIGPNNLVASSASSGGSGGGGGSGTGNRAEVELVPDANGLITPDGSISNRFRFKMTKNTKVANPINFGNDEHIYLTGHQDATGGWNMAFDKLILLSNALPYVPPLGPKATFVAEMRPTLNLDTLALNWAWIGTPDKTIPSGYGLVTELTQIGSVKYFTMADTFAQLNAMSGGGTAQVIRNGTSSEVTATVLGVAGATYNVFGVAVATNLTDPRPVLALLQTDYGTGGANRPSYGKALLNFELAGTVNLRDLVITGAWGADGTARGIAPNGNVTMNVNNCKVTNCNNGMLWGDISGGDGVRITDCVFDANGIGSNGINDGYCHNIYAGEAGKVYALRSTFQNAVTGHDFKSRADYTELKQCLFQNAPEGRELDVPNGGTVYVENCIFIKPDIRAQNELVAIGQEGVVTTRPRAYTFKNCSFTNNGSAGTTSTFVNNLDPDVTCTLIDCVFIGDTTRARSDKGVPGCVEQYTGGPVGPLAGLQIGYQTIPMTPIA